MWRRRPKGQKVHSINGLLLYYTVLCSVHQQKSVQIDKGSRNPLTSAVLLRYTTDFRGVEVKVDNVATAKLSCDSCSMPVI